MKKTLHQGFSFIELLVTVAIITLVFGGLMGALQFTMKLIDGAKISTSAMSLANERLEYIRSLTYDDVGTVAGIPEGPIPQNATTTLNGMLFHERVLIQYVDSPDDGTGASDANGILADYKEVKVEYSWEGTSGTSTVSLLTNVVPPGIESTTGGGTLTVNVFDASVLPVSGAAVRIYNDTTTSTIDTIRYTNEDGIAMFAGAPAAANYEITVTKEDYSSDGTLSATAENPNPTTPHVAVVESVVSTMNFQIDVLSDLLVRTIGPSTNESFLDSFADMNNSTSTQNVAIEGGALVLSGGAGAYAPTGSVFSIPVTPSPITSWDTVTWNSSVPPDTTLAVNVYSVSGTSYTLVPDSDLPGNSTGFATGTISLIGLDVGTYPSLALGATLTSSDPAQTPQLDEWEMSYAATEPVIASVPFTLRGNKVIGTTATATPIYKYDESHTTDAGGETSLGDMEWDSYSVTLDTTSYDVAEACPNIPHALDPGVSDTLTLTLVPAATRSLRVAVVDVGGNPLPGAEVALSRSGFAEEDTTGGCGQVFFNSGLTLASDYQLDITAAGYADQTVTNVSIEGAESMVITLISL